MFGKKKYAADNRSLDKAILKISEGDKEALSVIYDACGKLIYATAYQICRNSHDAADVLQDVMVAVAEKAGTYRQGSNPRAWILAITRNLSINKISLYDNSKTAPLEETAMPAVKPDMDSGLIIEEALATLSPDDRYIVYCKLYAGLSHKEIGDTLGISNAACSARYKRALKKLQAYFK